MDKTLLYIADGELYLQDSSRSTVLRSVFADRYMEKLRSNVQKNAWKENGKSAFLSEGTMHPGESEEKLARASCRILCADRHGRSVLYSLSLDGASGIYRRTGLQNAEEGIVISDDSHAYKDLTVMGDRLLLSADLGVESHIGILELAGGPCRFLTDGHSRDSQPTFSKTEPDVIYFASAGLAVDNNAPVQRPGPVDLSEMLLAMQNNPTLMPEIGPSSILRMNLCTMALDDEVGDGEHDFVRPQCGEDGSLYYIRRPHREQRRGGNLLLDILLFPVRLLQGLFGFFNFFTMRYSGKPLTSSGGVKRKNADQLFLDGNFISAEKELKKNRARKDAFPGIIPRSWELHRKKDGEDTVIARGVLSYAVSGEEVYISNGVSILRRGADGKLTEVKKAPRVTEIRVV